MTTLTRKPWLAAALSLAAPGLGQLYCGRLRRGLVLLALSLAFVPAAFVAAAPPPSLGRLVALFAATLLVPAVVLFALADAILRARRLPADFAPRRYQRLPVYLAFAALGLLALGSPLLVRRVAIEVFRIASGSMEPALAQGDYAIVGKLAAGAPLRTGDVIVFVPPGEGGRYYVKRVVALAGDRVDVREGAVLVNGAPGTGPEVVVPPGHVYVLGDAATRLRDSRDFGAVPIEAVVGRVFYVLSSRRVGVLPE